MPKTVLVTGATGLLGRQILQSFKSAGWNALGTGFSRADPPTILKIDLREPTTVSSILAEVKPDVVVHCAANRFPDKCDADPDGARLTNVEASQRLAQATSSRGALLIYLSTDYVFSGRPGEAPYEADAQPAPTNIYGQTKLDGENAILEATRSSGLGLVLRVPVLYGQAHEPKESAVNVLLDVLWKGQEKDAHIKMDDWAQRFPTNTEDVARVCLDICTEYLGNPQARQNMSRILQFSSEEKMTKYEICQVFADIMGLSLEGVVPEKQGGGPDASVQRPYDTHLSTKALQDAGISVRTQDFGAWWRWEMKSYRK